ncbi:MAG: MBL fold metallo-hydrolase, partial [Pseudomonadota bacterium]
EPLQLNYLANEGVAVFHDNTTVLFDPLFKESYGTYHLPDPATRSALLSGQTPYTSVDAVFVSHHHGDHFDPADMLELMNTHKNAQLYAPAQATAAMQQQSPKRFETIKDRVTGLDLNYDSPAQLFNHGTLLIEAFFVPHSGWPTARTDVQNIAFRVSIDGKLTVAHFGDADPNLVHFERHKNAWLQRTTAAALPPYWFFTSRDGKQILSEFVRPANVIGVHVPAKFSQPADLPEELREFDLFLKPGAVRVLSHDDHSH